MWAVIITLAALIAVILIISALVVPAVRKRQARTHEKLDEEYVYRKEPHADQTTQVPNKLDDNEITKG